MAMKDDKSVLVRLERIRIWERNKANDDASNDLVAGADDKIFRVDRADLRECAELAWCASPSCNCKAIFICDREV